MAENNRPTFSVDDILNEVRAMRGESPLSSTEKSTAEPKKTTADESKAANMPNNAAHSATNDVHNEAEAKPKADINAENAVEDKPKPQKKADIHKPDEKHGEKKTDDDINQPKVIDEVSISEALNEIIKKTKPVSTSAKQTGSTGDGNQPKTAEIDDKNSGKTAVKVREKTGHKANDADVSGKTKVKPHKVEKSVNSQAQGDDDLPQRPKTVSHRPNVITVDELNGGFEEKPFHVNQKRRPKVITAEEIQKSADSATLQFNPEDLHKDGGQMTPHERAVQQVDSLYGKQDGGQNSQAEDYEETKAERKARLKQEKFEQKMRRAEEKQQAKIQKRLAKHKASDEDYYDDGGVNQTDDAPIFSDEQKDAKSTLPQDNADITENSDSGAQADSDFDFTDIFKIPKEPQNEEIAEESEPEKPKSRAKAKAKSIIFGNDDSFTESEEEEDVPRAKQEKRRKSRPIKQKRAQADLKPDDEDDSVIDDYNNIDDAESVRGELDFKISGISKRSMATFWLFIISCVFTMLPCVGLNLPTAIAPTSHTTVYLMINALILAMAIIINVKTVFKGFLSLLKLRPDIDTAVSISVIACAVQIAISFIKPQSVRAGEGYLYYSLSLLALYLNLRGKKSMFLRVRSNFELVATTGTKQSCFSIKGKRSAELTDMNAPENVNVVCSRNVLNLHDFLYNSFSEDPSDRISRIFAPIGLCLAIVVGGIVYFVKGGDLSQTFGCVAAVAAMCVPLCAIMTVNKPLSKACKTVKEYGGLLSGYNSIESFHDAEYVVVNDYDLFPSGSIELLNLRAVGEESIDSVIMDAAALVMAAGGPLSDVFDRMIEGRVKSLKAVSGITYTDTVGLTGTVGEDKIDVGTRAMMENLGEINLPDKDVERKLARKNCFAVYIARNDNLCGMLVVKYTAKDEAITEQLQKLTDRGVALLVNSCDANISEELVENLFELNENTVHVMSSEAVLMYEQETPPRESDNSMLAHHNSLAGLCAALNAAKTLTGVITMAVIMQTVSVVLGLAVLIFFSFIGSSLILPINILAYQLICSLIIFISSSVRRIM